MEFYPYNLSDTLVKNNIYKDTDLDKNLQLWICPLFILCEFNISDIYVEFENTNKRFVVLKVLRKKFLYGNQSELICGTHISYYF